MSAFTTRTLESTFHRSRPRHIDRWGNTAADLMDRQVRKAERELEEARKLAVKYGVVDLAVFAPLQRAVRELGDLRAVLAERTD